MVHQFVLEKSSATRISAGIYKWQLSHQNRITNPKVVSFGPVSITSSADHRNFLIESDDFLKSDRGLVRRGDTLKPVVATVHPHQRFKHEYEQQVSNIAASTVDDIVTYWFDASDLTKFLNESYVQASVGESLDRYFVRQPSSGVTFYTSGDNKIKLVKYGPTASQLYGVTRLPAASWSYSIDSSTGNIDFNDSAADLYMIRLPSNVSGLDVGMKHRKQSWRVYNNEIQYQISSANTWIDCGFTLIPGEDYLLIFEEDQAASPPTKNVRLIRLSDATEQTHTGTARSSDIQSNNSIYISTAQSHMEYTQSSWIHMPLNAANVTTVVNYLKAQYSTPASESVTTYQLYDPRVTTIQMDPSAEPIRDLTLEFLDQNRTLFDPEDLLIDIKIET